MSADTTRTMRQLLADWMDRYDDLAQACVAEQRYASELSGRVVAAEHRALDLEEEVKRLREETATMHLSVVHDCCVEAQDARAAEAERNELRREHVELRGKLERIKAECRAEAWNCDQQMVGSMLLFRNTIEWLIDAWEPRGKWLP